MVNNERWSGSQFLRSVTVLYAEDHEETRLQTSSYLKRYIPNLITAAGGEEALKVTKGRDIDILVTDIVMEGMDGMDLAQAVKKRNPFCYIIIATAYSDEERMLKAIEIKADKYLVKPLDMKELLRLTTIFAEQAFTLRSLGFCRHCMDEDGFAALNIAADNVRASLVELSEIEETSASYIRCARYLRKALEAIKSVLKKEC